MTSADEAGRPAAPAPAATVVPLREIAPGGELEVLLVQRHGAASFMASAFVFPGGRVEPGDPSAADAALRELFEETGLLLARPPLGAAVRAAWRRRLLEDGAPFAALLATAGLTPLTGCLAPWSRSITPSVERKRFDARFFVAVVPSGDEPASDARETVATLWLTPRVALGRWAAGALALPPPQIVTLGELAAPAAAGLAGLALAVAARPHAELPILPRGAVMDGLPGVLFPWDPEYPTRGQGEAGPDPAPPRPAGAPDRLALGPTGWVATAGA